MKKTVVMILFFLCIPLFVSCSSERLANPYFDNADEDSLEEAYTLFNSYLEKIDTTIEAYFPRFVSNPSREYIYYDPTYILTDIYSNDVIYRHEFVNYHLSDDRIYLDDFILGYIVSSSSMHNAYVSAVSACEDIKEGEKCETSSYNNNHYWDIRGLEYYMDNGNLYLDFKATDYSDNTLYHYVFLFYQGIGYHHIMELSIGISDASESTYEMMAYVKLTIGEELEEYSCKNCMLSDPTQGYLEYRYIQFADTSYPNIPSDLYKIDHTIDISLKDNVIYGTIFNYETNEEFYVTQRDGVSKASEYTKYIRNTLLVHYSSTLFKVNLNEILGWDKLIKTDEGYNQYKLAYKDEVLSEDYYVSVVRDYHGEYAYFETRYGTNDLLSLSIFGLESGYSSEYFDDLLLDGSNLFTEMITEHHFDEEYSTLYDTFLTKFSALT
ncbi:MAG: hypothetical protein AB7U79_06005 [Candidatus Izemoplasmatales bacterium]